MLKKLAVWLGMTIASVLTDLSSGSQQNNATRLTRASSPSLNSEDYDAINLEYTLTGGVVFPRVRANLVEEQRLTVLQHLASH